MRKKIWIKRIVIGMAVLLGLAGAAVLAGVQLAGQKMQRKVAVTVSPVAWGEDAQALERGRYLYASRGCVDCHGANGAGKLFVDDGKGLRIGGPNISTGPGNVVAGYKPEDWVRRIRHGVAPDGRPLMIMPSEDFNRFTDTDLASLVGYIRSLPPAPGGGPILELPVPVRALYGFGVITDAAAKIDHTLAPSAPVEAGVNVPHGAYVANMCMGCHGEKLAGGKIPGGPPDWPAAANLTPGEGSVMGQYPNATAFSRMFKSGKRADGSEIKVMPFGSLREINDTDMQALYLYLQSLAPQPKG